MNTKKKVDMTQGPIMRLVLLFALPICAGNVLQQLYNTVDTLVIGNFCSSISLAAIGTSAQPVEMVLCIFLGMGTGVSILVSQCAGSGNFEKLRKLVSTTTTFVYMCSIPLSILGLFLGPLILKFMKVPEDAWNYSVAYIQIYFLGTLGNMGYNFNAGILRGMGDSKASLFFLLISCIVNIVLDLVFVAVFHWNVSGAALATIIAMFASWVFSIIYIQKRYPELEYSPIPGKPDRNLLGEIVKVGLPLGLNNSIYSVGHILMQSLINAQGSAFMAGCSVASKLTGIANVAITALASASCTFSGQNIGARNYVRLRQGHLLLPVFSGVITCIGGLIVTALCEPIIRLFTPDPEVIPLAVTYIRIVLPFTWLYAVFNGIINYVNGVGVVKYPTIVNILMLWAVRIPVAHLINRFIDGRYIMACLPISFGFGMICMLCYYRTGHWRSLMKLAKEQESKTATT
ncbi:MAG: MATE family efflux transporter [Lachnospiraceae bacterium]|nr:MATE family efflux transporter [Lachnospiraceae bacterium]